MLLKEFITVSKPPNEEESLFERPFKSKSFIIVKVVPFHCKYIRLNLTYTNMKLAYSTI